MEFLAVFQNKTNDRLLKTKIRIFYFQLVNISVHLVNNPIHHTRLIAVSVLLPISGISSSSVTKGSFFVKWFNARKRVVIPERYSPERYPALLSPHT